jgi:two-component system alkaline phosphatase synthesis response regulator PhoP
MAVNILVVDDEINILELIKFNLELNNYKVYTAENGREGIEKINQINFDLIILDLMMPEVDGIQLCKYVRGNEEFETIPIIMLTAKSTEIDKIFGLEIGADDYITKPFSVKELQARVKALLRRSSMESNTTEEVINYKNMKINTSQHIVRINNEEIRLTLKEYEVLLLLATNKGKVFTRDNLLNEVWGYDYIGETRTVDVHIRHLRKKIEFLDAENEYIETVRGVGYKIK